MNKHVSDTRFMDLINMNKGIIWKICLFYAHNEPDREDLFQDIVLQAWKSFPGFRNDSRFSTWLYRVALNTALTTHRRQKLRIEPLSPDAEMHGSPTADREASERLHAAIRTLNDIEKSLVLLYLDGYHYEDMEKITGIAGGTLRVKMARVKQKLKTLLK